MYVIARMILKIWCDKYNMVNMVLRIWYGRIVWYYGKYGMAGMEKQVCYSRYGMTDIV